MSKNNTKTWGLYWQNFLSLEAVPLKSLDIDIQILHNTARVLYTQVYNNQTEKYLECEFFFPIAQDACFDSFQAKFNDTVIEGVIKKKEQAKEEYKEAISQGRTAAYSEINEETGDIMKVMIGNIPPKTEISIIYSYIEKIETSLNKFWCFRLFSTITPRYNGNLKESLDQDITLLSSYPIISSNSSNAFPWTIKAEIQSPSPITLVKSPSHQITTNYGNEKHTCLVTLDSKSKHFPNKDFILLYANGKEGEKVDYVMTPFEEGYCAMVTLLADFEKASNEEAYVNFAKSVKPIDNSHSMDTIRGEYIFLIDRSGSMSGDRIEMAKSSLLLFLKSLPKDSYFNIVSFGTSFEFLRKDSVLYSKDSLTSLSKEVQGFGADMGGTEIYNAIKTVFNMPLKKGYPRFVFLLTDGDISNTSSVLELIKRNNEKARVFTIGIGNGCSPELVTKAALYGRGKHEFVSDNHQTLEKVISLLNASLSPCYSDFTLEGKNFDAVVKSVSPNPSTFPFLINGQTISFFLFLREAAFEETGKMPLELKMYDTRIGKQKIIKIVLDKKESIENHLIPKLAIHDMMKRLEDAENENQSLKDFSDFIWIEKKDDIKKSLVEYSLKYGILCKETAFFCDIKENNQIQKTLPVKVVIPTIASVDYDRVDRFHSFAAPFRSTIGLSSTSFSAAPQSYQSNNVNYYRSSSNSSLQSSSSYSGGGSYRSSCTLSSARPETKGLGSNFFSMGDKISSAFKSLGSFFSKDKRKTISSPKTSNQSKLDSQPSQITTGFDKKQVSSYLEVIMKQTFEGNWESNDQELITGILKDGKLPQVPTEIKSKAQIKPETIWITILVLLWLDSTCQKDKGAWALIHQKGCEWLNSQGVNYQEVKNVGKSYIKS